MILEYSCITTNTNIAFSRKVTRRFHAQAHLFFFLAYKHTCSYKGDWFYFKPNIFKFQVFHANKKMALSLTLKVMFLQHWNAKLYHMLKGKSTTDQHLRQKSNVNIENAY